MEIQYKMEQKKTSLKLLTSFVIEEEEEIAQFFLHVWVRFV